MLAPHPDQKSDGSRCNSVTSIFINHLFKHLFAIIGLSRNPKPAFTQLKICQRETLTLLSLHSDSVLDVDVNKRSFVVQCLRVETTYRAPTSERHGKTSETND